MERPQARNLEAHVIPRLGGVALMDLNATHFNRLYADLLDLAASTLTVRQTIVATAEGFQPQDEQKSEGSARTTHLDRRTVAQLRAHRAAQSEAKLALGSAWQDNNLVFLRGDGSWWNPPAITLAFRRAVDRSGVRPIRCRTSGTRTLAAVLAAGVNPKVVSEPDDEASDGEGENS